MPSTPSPKGAANPLHAVDDTTAIGLALGGYILVVGVLAAVMYYVGQTQTLGGRIPTFAIVVLVLLGPLGVVGLLLLWFRFRQGRLSGEHSPP